MHTSIRWTIMIVAPFVMVAGLAAQAPSSAVPDLNGVWGWGRCVGGEAGAAGRGGAAAGAPAGRGAAGGGAAAGAPAGRGAGGGGAAPGAQAGRGGGGGGGGIGCMIIEPDSPLLTDRARAFQKAFDEIAAPKYDCAPMSVPHLYTDPYAFQIEQQKDRVILRYEKDDVVRTVWLEGFGHKRPALNQFFVHGYATGRYEGDTLVVETTRFTFDPMGLNSDFKMPTSAQKKVTERFRRAGDALEFEVMTEDTFFLKKPWVYRVRSAREKGELSLPWDCDLEAARQSMTLLTTDYPNDPPVVRLPEGK